MSEFPTVADLQSAYADYSRTNDLRPLAEKLKQLLIYVANDAQFGHDADFLAIIPRLLKFLNSIEIE